MFTQKDFREAFESREPNRSSVVVDRWHFWNKGMWPEIYLREWGFGLSYVHQPRFRGLDIEFLCFCFWLGIWK